MALLCPRGSLYTGLEPHTAGHVQHFPTVMGSGGVEPLWSLLQAGEATFRRELLQGRCFGVSETPWGMARMRGNSSPGKLRLRSRLLFANAD